MLVISVLRSADLHWLSQGETSQLVYLRDGPAETVVRVATLRQKLQIKLTISPSHSVLVPAQLVTALTVYEAPGRVAADMTPPGYSLTATGGFEPGLLL